VRRALSIPQNLWLKFKTFSLKKKIFVVVGMIIAFFIISGIISNATKKPDYSVAKAAKADLTEQVTETGHVSVSGVIPVYSPTNGIVEEVYIKNGEMVSDGQDLVKVNSSATQQEQQAAYANYLAAKNVLDSASSDLHLSQASMLDAWDEYKNLAKSGAYENGDGSPRNDQRTSPEFHISQKEWLAAEAKYKDQQSVIAKGQAQVSSAWLLYQATQNSVVKAPSGGIVENLAASVGKNVAINAPTQPGVPILTLSTASGAAEIVVSLSEGDISKVAEGQSANIEIPSLDKTYKGFVTRVDSIGTQDAGVIRYNVYLEIEDVDNNLKTGMTADATIITKKLSDTLSVPNSAVKPYKGGRAVRVMKNGKVEYIPVKIGTRGTTKTQILSGIAEGQEVVTALSNEQLKRPGVFN
jgi:RND family efflux transporter MFP subunit